MNIMVSIVFQFFRPITKKPVPNPISGHTIPKTWEYFLFRSNKTPIAKYTMPKASIGKALGSRGSLNIGSICKTPAMSISKAAK
jgi:hypothetical protein